MTPDSQAILDKDQRKSVSFMHRRSRCYALSASISSVVTTIATYEAYTRLESSDQVEVIIGGGAGLLALVGGVAMLGCAQSAIESHRWSRALERNQE